MTHDAKELTEAIIDKPVNHHQRLQDESLRQTDRILNLVEQLNLGSKELSH